MTAHLTGGFAQHAKDAARAFRAAMEAMARPGRPVTLTGARPPAPLSPAAGTLVLTLCDATTPVCLAPGHDVPEVARWIAFHTGAPLCHRDAAAFAIGSWAALQPLAGYRVGTAAYPDRSATLIVEGAGSVPARATGPGIDGDCRMFVPDIAALQANAAGFPLGLDFFFCDGDRATALARSTRLEAA
jgi:alpha-D-ribose 1-methylphosphonate 5-triphosphate synthase subunit PhnH